MARKNRLSVADERQLKFEILCCLVELGAKTTKDIADDIGDIPRLTPQQIKYYINKFHFNLTLPFACNEDMQLYYDWCDEMEVKGNWLGPKTTLQTIIDRQASLNLEHIRMCDVTESPAPPVEGKVYSYSAMIKAAKTNPEIKNVGDWERICNVTE